MIEQGKDTERLFAIERYTAGYFAVRDANPRFAIAASSAGEAAELAIKALAIAIEDRQGGNEVPSRSDDSAGRKASPHSSIRSNPDGE